MACHEAYGTEKMNFFMRGIYKEDVFIPRERALDLSKSLYAFVHAYLWEASKAYQLRVASFPLFPKLHAVHEIGHALKVQATRCPYAMNPAVHSCSMDEDFIGRCAAITRCVSPKLIAKRTIQRYLCHIQIAWARGFDRK